MHDLDLKVQKLKQLALEYNLTLSTAESCTGGSLAACITNVPGCSAWFERGFVTYSNSAKHEMLGVPIDLLEKFGAVSGEVVKAMAEGALINSHADISIAITGIAGPDGGSATKPVGTVWIGYASKYKLRSIDNSSSEALRPATGLRDSENLVNTKTNCFSSNLNGSRDPVARHRDMQCQPSLESQCYFFNGDRQKIREKTVFESINGAITFISNLAIFP